MTRNPDAFDALYRRHHPAVLLFLARRTTMETAEDVAHEAFLTAWRKLSAVPSEPNEARVWLCVVARNVLLNQTRGENRHQALAMRIAENAATHVDGPENSVMAAVDFAAGWNSLRAEEQEVIALTAWDEFTSTQAARILGISAVAYRTRLKRARKALRTALESPTPVTPANRINRPFPPFPIKETQPCVLTN